MDVSNEIYFKASCQMSGIIETGQKAVLYAIFDAYECKLKSRANYYYERKTERKQTLALTLALRRIYVMYELGQML